MECKKCGVNIARKSEFCSEKCRRNWRYHNVPGVKESDKEYSKEYKQEWNNKNTNYYAEWAEKNPEKVKKYKKEWAEKNPDKAKPYALEWAEKNPEKVKKYKKEWAEKNPEKIKVYKTDYKLRGDKCKECGYPKNLEFHHTNYKNHEGITLCISCHKELHRNERRML